MISKLLAAAIGAVLVLPMHAQAQQSRPPADPADPGAPVPPIVYRSVIASPAPALHGGQATPDKTPDKVWRAANDALASPTDADAGNQQHRHGHAAAAAPSTPATPQVPAGPTPVDHSKHH